MNALADRITSELQRLVGRPFTDCRRVCNLHIFEFGPKQKRVNRKGQVVELAETRIHVSCPWRVVQQGRILFGSDDLYWPADDAIPLDDFDWHKHNSVLDVASREWLGQHRDAPLKVISAAGNDCGGFRIQLEESVLFEAFPCSSPSRDYSEHWSLLDDRSGGTYLEVTANGIEEQDEPLE